MAHPVTVIGTVINMATVLVGGFVGVSVGDRLNPKMRETVMMSLGLMTLVVGCKMGIRSTYVLVPLISVLVGGIIGEYLQIQERLESLGGSVEGRFGSGANDGRFSQAFVTGTLIFCIGPLTFVGSIQQGLDGNSELLLINASLDFFVAMAFGASLGVGVMFAALSVLFVQGTLTVLAVLLSSQIGAISETTPWVVEFGATGGVLILGISVKLLKVGKPRIANLLPAVVLAPLIVLALQGLGIID